MRGITWVTLVGMLCAIAPAAAPGFSIGSPTSLGVSGELQTEASAYDPVLKRYIVAWNATVGTGSLRKDLFTQILDADGEAVTGIKRLSYSGPDDADTVYAQGGRVLWSPVTRNFLVGWTRTVNSDYTARARGVSSTTGNAIGSEVEIAAGHLRSVRDAPSPRPPFVVAYLPAGVAGPTDTVVRTMTSGGTLSSAVPIGVQTWLSPRLPRGAWPVVAMSTAKPYDLAVSFRDLDFGPAPTGLPGTAVVLSDTAATGGTGTFAEPKVAYSDLSQRMAAVWVRTPEAGSSTIRLRTLGSDGVAGSAVELASDAVQSRPGIRSLTGSDGFAASWVNPGLNSVSLAVIDALGARLDIRSVPTDPSTSHVEFVAGDNGRGLLLTSSSAGSVVVRTVTNLPQFADVTAPNGSPPPKPATAPGPAPGPGTAAPGTGTGTTTPPAARRTPVRGFTPLFATRVRRTGRHGLLLGITNILGVATGSRIDVRCTAHCRLARTRTFSTRHRHLSFTPPVRIDTRSRIRITISRRGRTSRYRTYRFAKTRLGLIGRRVSSGCSTDRIGTRRVRCR